MKKNLLNRLQKSNFNSYTFIYTKAKKKRNMGVLSKEAEDRLQLAIDVFKGLFQYGYLPLVIYLGWTYGPEKGSPPFSVTNFLWYY